MSPEPTLMRDVFEEKSGVKFEPAANNLHVCSKVQEIQTQCKEI